MRAGVYNRYWSTGGGAEKYGAAIASLLTRRFDVDLLTHDPVDLDWLGERLHVDLSGVGVREVGDQRGAVTAASGDYDLFSNVSFMSTERAASPRSIYVVHFPTATNAYLPPLQRYVVDHLGPTRGPIEVGMEWGEGFHHRESGRRAPMWTNGDAVVRFVTPPDKSVPVGLLFGFHRPPDLPPATVRVERDGELVGELTLGAPASRAQALRGCHLRVEVQSPDHDVPVELRIVSDTFVPSEIVGGADRRTLGVPLLGIHVGGGAATRLARWFPQMLTPPATSSWTRSYGALAANSRFTQTWIERYWQTESEVLYPPVTMHQTGDKQPMILNVGRFFPADGGHSKKQLELVRAFHALCDQGVRGWRLCLVGGCAADGESYVARVRELIGDRPIDVHVNAPGEQLASLYRQASIYWHASGLGENQRRRPDRLEHFGITTVEAMSAGAVPVVIGLAGQLETVRHGVDGYHFTTLDGLVGLTRMLIDDPDLRSRMSASATSRAREFSMDAFATRLDGLVDRVMSSPDPTPGLARAAPADALDHR